MSGRPSPAQVTPRGFAARGGWIAAALLLIACSGGPPAPAVLDTAHEPCGWCRMTVSSREFAAQLVAPAEEPRFFDDLGCLRDYLAAGGKVARGSVVYVADHRTREWVRGAVALYTRQPGLETPMGSHLIAHADAASRGADPAAAGGETVTAAALFGPAGVPDGGPDGRPDGRP